MKNMKIKLAAIGLVIASSSISWGNGIISSCVGCHGQNGIGLSDMFPNLAGQKKAYMIKQLNDFKSGVRQNQMMSPMAAQLTPQDMEDVSAYFASLKN